MTKQRAAAAQKLHNAWMHLADYRRDAANNVAQELISDAERRVRNGFGPVPQQDCENLLAIEHEYNPEPEFDRINHGPFAHPVSEPTEVIAIETNEDQRKATQAELRSELAKLEQPSASDWNRIDAVNGEPLSTLTWESAVKVWNDACDKADSE